MKKRNLISVCLISAVLVFGQNVLAEPMGKTKAISTMATITSHLNHRPDSAGKQMLNDIVNSDTSTTNEKAIASAMLGMNHKVEGSAKDELRSILSNDSATESEKTLASILVNLHHQASSGDQKELQALAK